MRSEQYQTEESCEVKRPPALHEAIAMLHRQVEILTSAANEAVILLNQILDKL